MSANEIYQWWYIWLAIGGGIVVAAAALLITIILLAHRIATLAQVAIGVVQEIEQNTKPIWQLNVSKKVAKELLVGASAIENNAVTIVKVLSKKDEDRAA